MSKAHKPVDSFTDKLGMPVTRGSFIAYGHALGRCAGIRIGIVLEICEDSAAREWEKWRIKVMGVDDEWSHQEAKLGCKCGTLMYPSRIIKVSSVPDRHRVLLKDYYRDYQEKKASQPSP